MAAAAMATTTRLKKSAAASVLNRGAISTPARPANSDDSAQANGRDPIGGDAVELGHPGALDDRPHLQADGAEAEQRAEAEHGDDGDGHRDELVAAEGVDAERVVEDAGAVGHEPSGRRRRRPP